MKRMQCQLIHQTAERIRFRVPVLKTDNKLANLLENYLTQLEGIISVRINLVCSSLVIEFDVDNWSVEEIQERIENLERDVLESIQIFHPSIPKGDSTQIKGELLYSGLAFLSGWVLGTVAFPITAFLLAAGAKSMFKRAYHVVTRENRLNVDVLDASATAVLALQGLLPPAAFMVWFVNLADYIRDATVERSQKAISEMLEFQENKAWLVEGETRKQINVKEVRKGNTLVVYPGEMVPVDGKILSGSAALDQKTLTGESKPIYKNAGDMIYAGTVILEGKVYISAERISGETEMDKIVHMVQNAPTHDTRVQNYAEIWANSLVPYSFIGAGASILLERGFGRAASILIIDYGTGIRIAAPTTILSSMTKAAYNGILIKGGRHIERLAEVDAVVLDKTGTLTMGIPQIKEIFTYYNGTIHSVDDVLALAAAAEQRLRHPSAKAIVQEAQRRGLIIPERQKSSYTIGAGIEAKVNGYVVQVGSRMYLENKHIAISGTVLDDLRNIENQILSPLLVACDHEVIGLLGLEDPVHPEAAKAIQDLRDIGIKEVVMLTGDHANVAEKVAKTLGIDRFIANAHPEQKMNAIRELQSQGYIVAVVGDGINDSPALAQADVGIAVHNSTDVAKEIAHVVLHNQDLGQIHKAVMISREGMKLIHQNWRLISIPNTMALALVFMGIIGPVSSTIISNGSAIIAALNALRPIWVKGLSFTKGRE